MPKKKATKKKVTKPKYGNLDDDQRKFIRAKVKSLKTIKAVEAFYKREDMVTKFARDLAKKLKLPKE